MDAVSNNSPYSASYAMRQTPSPDQQAAVQQSQNNTNQSNANQSNGNQGTSSAPGPSLDNQGNPIGTTLSAVA